MFRKRAPAGVSVFFPCCFVLPIVTLARPPVYRVVEIGTLGGERSEARAIGDGGHVVGWSETGAVDAHGNAIHHAFLWCDGEMTDLGTLGGLQSEAYAVNGLGANRGLGGHSDRRQTRVLVASGARVRLATRNERSQSRRLESVRVCDGHQ